MNNKGESQIAMMVVMAVALMVALAFLPTIFGAQKQMTDTFKVNNYTITLGDNGTWTDTPWQEVEGSFVFHNATGDRILVSNANFSVREEVSSSKNVKRVQISPCGASTCGWNSSTINVTGTVGLEGYVDDAGGRSLAGIIGLFSAVAVLAVCLFYWAKGNGWISGF